MMATRKRGGGIAALLVLLTAAGAAIVWGPGLWDRYGDRVLPSGMCTVSLGDRADTKSAEQANNIALIVAGSIRHDLPARAATIAVATAMQESSLRNIDYGDRDSVGLFQQRTSQGWGTVEEILDPHYSTDKFYDQLTTVSGWQDMEITVAAQAVQRSGFPEAYADHEEEGRLWASALTGHGGDVTCDLDDGEPTTTRAFSERMRADFGADTYEVLVPDLSSEVSVLSATSSDAYRDAALQRWAVAVAASESVVASSDGDRTWARGDSEPPSGPGTRVAIRTE